MHSAPAGTWVGSYGTDGYSLLAWNTDGTSVSTLLGSGPAHATLVEGGAPVPAVATTDPKALLYPSGTERHFAGRSDPTNLTLTLSAPPPPSWSQVGGAQCPWTDAVHLYAVDPQADPADVEHVTVMRRPSYAPFNPDGSPVDGFRTTVDLSQLASGVWLDVPIKWSPGFNVGPGLFSGNDSPLQVTVSVTRTGPSNRVPVFAGFFVGDNGPPPQLPEAPLALLLPTTAASLVAGWVVIRRRRINANSLTA